MADGQNNLAERAPELVAALTQYATVIHIPQKHCQPFLPDLP